jgi:hypothetical protein
MNLKNYCYHKPMKNFLIRLFWPILKIFEKGGDAAGYKPSHRTILIIVGSLFIFLSSLSGVMALSAGEPGALFPVVIFFCVGAVALIVGTLGSDAAVSKIWGSH